MKVLITGATGFVGKRLARRLADKGHALVVLTRKPDQIASRLPLPAQAFKWNAEEEAAPAAAFAGVDAVLHLAGEGIAEHRWSAAQKQKIYQSRIAGTQNLMRAIVALPEDKRPKVVVSASAIGFYGDRKNELLDESSKMGAGFLAEVCGDWEAELVRQKLEKVRTVLLRIGMVLGSEGGALKKLFPLFKAGVGGPVGSGKQWVSWIHVDDLVSLFIFAMENPSATGVLNAVAPTPVTNEVFSHALGKALHRPSFMKAPALALKLAMGEMAELVLASQRVVPKRTLAKGFSFSYPEIDGALEEICKKKAV